MNFKIKITSPEHSKSVQEAMFKRGGNWLYGEPKNTPQYVDQHFLYLIDDVITYGHNDITFFNNHPATEVFLQPDGTLSETELNVQQFAKMRIEILNTYHSECVQAALFKLGYKWYDCPFGVAYHKDKKWLWANGNGSIGYSYTEKVAYDDKDYALVDLEWLDKMVADKDKEYKEHMEKAIRSTGAYKDVMKTISDAVKGSSLIPSGLRVEVEKELRKPLLEGEYWTTKEKMEKAMKDKEKDMHKEYLMVSKSPDVVKDGTLKNSGVRVEVGTGAVRERVDGKGRFDLLPAFGLYSIARQMELGAQKYSERNWELGMPLSWFASSAARHLSKFIAGYDDEPHLAAAQWNLMCLAEGQERIRVGLWPKELDDLPKTYAGIAPSF